MPHCRPGAAAGRDGAMHEDRVMSLCRFPKADALPHLALAALAAAVVTAPARAADIQGHAITYQVSVDKLPPQTDVDAQLTVSLSRDCEAWDYSSGLLYSIERNVKRQRKAGQPLGNKAEQFQERVKFSERREGSALIYEGRYYVNGRGEDVKGLVRMEGEGAGTLDVKSAKMPRKTDLPPGTLLPVAMRSKLIDALMHSEPGKAFPPVSFQTVELNRFYAPVDVTFAPAAKLAPLPVPKGEKPRVVRSPLLEGRWWTVKQTSRSMSEWMESTFDLYATGVIARFTFRREGILFRADVKEVNTFSEPKCGG
jgi:hypothetical protein